MSKTSSIGLGPVLGTVKDRRQKGALVESRTDAAFAEKFARGYKSALGSILTTHKAGTQYGHYRAAAKRTHLGEDLYLPPGAPVYAPFTGVLEAIYPASRTEDYADILVIRSTEDPRIKTRLVHLRGDHPAVGSTVKQGDQVGTNYTPARFPGGDPAHVHLEAVVYDKAGTGKPGDKGNVHPFSAFNAAHIATPTPEGSDMLALAVTAGITALVAAGLYLVGREVARAA